MQRKPVPQAPQGRITYIGKSESMKDSDHSMQTQIIAEEMHVTYS